MVKETPAELKRDRDFFKRMLENERTTKDVSPRWIADIETMILSERQQDNSYKPTYKMTLIS